MSDFITQEFEKAIRDVEHQNADLRAKLAANDNEIQQICGKALGYPWFKDDQQNFPGTTERDGVCVGDHVGVTIARELAAKLEQAEADNAALREGANIVAGLLSKMQIERDAALARVKELERQADDLQICTHLERILKTCEKLEELQAALAQPAAPSARGRMHSCDIPECVACGNPPYLEYEQEGRDE